MEKYCISVDWLHVCCYSNNLAFLLNNDYYSKVDSLPYWLELQPLETRSFARFIPVHKDSRKFFGVCAVIIVYDHPIVGRLVGLPSSISMAQA